MKNDWLRGVRSGSIALLAIVALTGCGGDGGGGGTVTYSISGRVTLTGTQSARIVACPPTGTTDVTIQDFSYTPTGVTIGVKLA